ncbi:MAG TPA: hypothetical protein VK897_26530 [Anaerolineales bacterium]|nr:hypothetical protein [Anaerolineales bacterium]
MIISHKNKYLFVEIPHTGSTAISHELRANYDGEKILRKHSFYSDFLKIASPEEQKYFVFAGIRNPADEAVTRYFRLKMLYQRESTHPKKRSEIGNLLGVNETGLPAGDYQEGMDFETFFMKHYRVPYNNFSSLIRDRSDFLLRFENLQEDFAELLQRLGLEPKRPLPVRNTTQGRNKDFWSYYSPAMIPRAKRVFGPFMQQWGYEFPAAWTAYSPTWWSKVEYELFNRFRNFKWKMSKSMTRPNGHANPLR